MNRLNAAETPLGGDLDHPQARTLLRMRLIVAARMSESIPNDATLGMVLVALVAVILAIPIVIAIALKPGRRAGEKKFERSNPESKPSAWEESGRRIKASDDEHMGNYG